MRSQSITQSQPKLHFEKGVAEVKTDKGSIQIDPVKKKRVQSVAKRRDKKAGLLSPRLLDQNEIKANEVDGLLEATQIFLLEIEDEMYTLEQNASGSHTQGDDRDTAIESWLENNKSMQSKVQEIVDAILKVEFKLKKSSNKPAETQQEVKVNPKIEELEKQLAASQVQIRNLKKQHGRVKEDFNSQGDNYEKKSKMENELVDLDRTKAELQDVLKSYQKYISESENVMLNSSKAKAKNEKVEIHKKEIIQEQKRYKELKMKFLENRTDIPNNDLHFQQVVGINEAKKMLKQEIQELNGIKPSKHSFIFERSPKKGSQDKETIARENEQRKENLISIQRNHEIKTKDIQQRYLAVVKQVRSMMSQIDSYKEENLAMGHEIKVLSESVNPKQLEIITGDGGNQQTGPSNHGFNKGSMYIVFNRNYAKAPKLRDNSRSRYALGEINRSLDTTATNKAHNLFRKRQASYVNQSVNISSNKISAKNSNGGLNDQAYNYQNFKVKNSFSKHNSKKEFQPFDQNISGIARNNVNYSNQEQQFMQSNNNNNPNYSQQQDAFDPERNQIFNIEDVRKHHIALQNKV